MADSVQRKLTAILSDASVAAAHAALAKVFRRDGDREGARKAIEKVLQLDPQSFEVQYAAADWHYIERRFAEAIPYYER